MSCTVIASKLFSCMRSVSVCCNSLRVRLTRGSFAFTCPMAIVPPPARWRGNHTSRQSHSNMSISCSDCGGRARQLVLEEVIEADAVLTGKRMCIRGLVGREEVHDGVC